MLRVAALRSDLLQAEEIGPASTLIALTDRHVIARMAALNKSFTSCLFGLPLGSPELCDRGFSFWYYA